MKSFAFILSFIFILNIGYSQKGKVINNVATLFSINANQDIIDFIVVNPALNQRKPIFLWCQGSLPMPLFCGEEGLSPYFFGGGVVNFDYKDIAKKYHIVVISMPKTPALAPLKNLNSNWHFVPDTTKPDKYLPEYLRANYLDNYVQRGLKVLEFLKDKPWVDNEKLVVVGHSQGTKVASKIALKNKEVTHLGLFSANPFGRMDQFIRTARLNAQLGKISWREADSTMDNLYDEFEKSFNNDSIISNPNLLAVSSFSEKFLDDWMELDIPIYLAYGTEDRVSDLCDIVPLYFIEQRKNNLTMKRYLGLEHNFFETDTNGKANYDKPHYPEVMKSFLQWLK